MKGILPSLALLLASSGGPRPLQDADRPAPPRAEDPADIARRAGADREAKEKLLRTFAEKGIFLDAERGRIEIEGRMNFPHMPVEYLLTSRRGATHECLFVTDASPSLLTAAVFVLGLERGKNVEYKVKEPPPTEEEMRAGVSPYETIPPRGDGLYVYVEWTEGEEVRQYRVEDLIQNDRTGRALPRQPWVFLGSRFVRTARGDPEVFAAEAEGNLVAVTYFALGNQIFTYPHPDAATQNAFTPNAALLPDRGSPVRIIFSRQRLERSFSSERRNG
ncbi:MAG TPA: YdjY domain-containing protein [Planctomycetota bacterium]|nr:YdjY domain-containing protein [Planctomycetota bacterium]